MTGTIGTPALSAPITATQVSGDGWARTATPVAPGYGVRHRGAGATQLRVAQRPLREDDGRLGGGLGQGREQGFGISRADAYPFQRKLTVAFEASV